MIDETARIHWQSPVPPTAKGLTELLGRPRRFRQRGALRVALERPSGLLVDTLIDAGAEVVPIHPNALKAGRRRYSAAGGESDPGDAFILADLLRTDGHRFRPPRVPSDETRTLRALVRGRDDLIAQRVALANQLRALLERFWPGTAAIFADVASPIALALLTRYPTSQSAARLGEQRLAQFLRQHAYGGRRPVAELLDRLRSAPPSQVGEAEAEASGEVVRALVAVVSRWACNRRLRRALTTLADNSRHGSRWAALVYQRARARGCRHQHAIRILARAWSRILWRCWQHRTPYDVARHRAAALVAAWG
ncbi:MAG TPA: transposase [Candidatus Binatia bacterium]|nr:transposase [Candidatus Binatia bacterium]